MEMPKKVTIMDITIRDGFQHEEKFIPTDSKLWIVNNLIDAGFRSIEVGTFSHIKYVPQFKDIEELLMLLPKRDDLEYTVLALNGKACERAVEAMDKGAKIDRVLCGQLATSEAYAKKNMNRTHEELFSEAEKNVKFLHDHGVKKVFANVGTIFGCPVQGEVPIEKAYEFVERSFEIGFDEIEHSDTDGIADPETVYNYFSKVMEINPDTSKHSFHVHDIRGMGMTAYYAAMQAGVTLFDTTMGGIGGQVANIVDGIPVKGAGEYYFESRRTGLGETCDFVSMCNRMGIETGIDENKAYAVCQTVEKIVGRELDSFTSSVRYAAAGSK